MKFRPAGLAFVALATFTAVAPGQQPLSENDKLISAHAQRLLSEGRRIFRFDTMGSESFWGDALHCETGSDAGVAVVPLASPGHAFQESRSVTVRLKVIPS